MITNRRFLNRRVVMFVVMMSIVLTSLGFPVKARAYEEITVVIDPGHGGDGDDDATYKGAIYHDLYEKDINLVTATAFYEELSQYGNLNVYMTRSDDRKLTLEERVMYAKSVDADYLISVHYNASLHHRFYGSEIFTSAFSEEYAKGYSLASTVMNWWEESGRVSKGIKTRIGKRGTDYYGLIRIGREQSIPTIILEHGYLDNDTDFNELNTEEAWKHMGVLDALAVADYLGVKKGVVSADAGGKLVTEVPSERMEPDVTPPADVSVIIDDYDPDTGILSYTITASEPDSKLMYYDLNTEDLALDEDAGFRDLKVWDKNAETVKGTYLVPDGYSGEFVARVYNNYELFTDTDPLGIPEEFLRTESLPENTLQFTPVEGVQTADAEVDEQDEKKSGTWSLANVFAKGEKGVNTVNTGHGQTGRSNYVGMIVAFSIAGIMLIAAVVLAIVSAISRRHRRR